MKTANLTLPSAGRDLSSSWKARTALTLIGLCGGLLGVARQGLAQEIRAFTGHAGEVYSVAFSRDGQRALSGSGDMTARLWDVSTGQMIRAFTGHADRVWSAAFSRDGKYVATGSGDRTARLWDISTGQAIRTLAGHTREVACAAFSVGGGALGTALARSGSRGTLRASRRRS